MRLRCDTNAVAAVTLLVAVRMMDNADVVESSKDPQIFMGSFEGPGVISVESSERTCWARCNRGQNDIKFS
jgi:hypothetical protein